MSFTTTVLREFEGEAGDQIYWTVSETKKGEVKLRIDDTYDRKTFNLRSRDNFIDLISALNHLAQKMFVEDAQTPRSKVKPGSRGRSKTVDGDSSITDAIMEQVFEVPREDK